MSPRLARASSALLLAAACARRGAPPAPAQPEAAAAAPPPVAVTAPVAPAPAPARLVAPEPVRFSGRAVVTGSLRARQSAPLALPLAGTLARIAVRRGEEVRQGALLAALDDALVSAVKKQAEAGLDSARAQLALAEDAFDRVERIRREDGSSESQLVSARAQRDLARAGVAAAEAQLEQARVNLSHHYLAAPFAGVVTRIPDGIGLSVAAGTPLVSLACTRLLVLDTSLTQEEAAEVHLGDRVTVTVVATGATSAEAVVSAVVPAVDPGTNRVPVEIEVPNRDGRFLANAFARAELPRGKERQAFRVPAAALVQRAGNYSLWVTGPERRARALPVRVLSEEGVNSVVLPEGGSWPEGLKVVDLPPLGIAEGIPLVEVRG